MKGFGIVGPGDLGDELVEYAEQGALRGNYLGFPNIAEFYSISYPGVTDWTGFPQSGKSQVLFEFLLVQSLWYGVRHYCFVPDIGDKVEVIADLIHKLTGKTFDKRYDNHITPDEIMREMPWVTDHFKIVYKKEVEAKMHPLEFWQEAALSGCKSAVIDSWKDLRHDEKEYGRTDQYLEHVLSARNQLADRKKMHIHTIIHPVKTEFTSSGKRRMPGPYDMKGGSEWYNNARNSITVHRPDGSENGVEIFFNKIKPRSVGKPGRAVLYFDVRRFRYYFQDDDGKHYYARPENETPKQDEQKGKDYDDSGDEIPF